MKAILIVYMVIGINCTGTGVYVCDSKYAIRYHYRANCPGLNNCKHPIVRMPIDEARKMNRTCCKWER